MNFSVSDTAEYGGMSRGPKIINNDTKIAMKKILSDIQDGSFAKEWLKENESGQPVMNKLRNETKEHLIEKVGSKLRKMIKLLPAEK